MNLIKEKLNLFRRNRMMCEVKMDQVREIVKSTKLDVYVQPIVGLQENNQYGAEYLNRPIKGSEFVHPGEFYAFAATHGMNPEVDVCAIENILTHISEQVKGKIFIHVIFCSLEKNL